MTLSDDPYLFHDAVEDLMAHLGYRLAPFLPVLLSITTLLLAEGTRGIGGRPAGPGGGEDRSRELRTGSLKILSLVWSRFPMDVDHRPFLEPLMNAMQPIIGRLPAESFSDK